MMRLLCAAGLGEVASSGRKEEGKSCVLGSLGVTLHVRQGWGVCGCVFKSS